MLKEGEVLYQRYKRENSTYAEKKQPPIFAQSGIECTGGQRLSDYHGQAGAAGSKKTMLR